VVIKAGGKVFEKFAPRLYEKLGNWIDNLFKRHPPDPSDARRRQPRHSRR
jgi:hypothetical protein